MTDGALAGLRVIDAATLAAGPLIATWMGEQGAEVVKVEQPDGGDPLRQWGAQRDGIGLMWKSVARNKKCGPAAGGRVPTSRASSAHSSSRAAMRASPAYWTWIIVSGGSASTNQEGSP